MDTLADGQSLLDVYRLYSVEESLVKVINSIADAVGIISKSMQTGNEDFKASSTMTFNKFGDEQLHIDVLADQVIFGELKLSGAVATASSEETAEEVNMGGVGYSVAFDPLDGSSIIDANFAVGSIFGVWKGDKLIGQTGRDQVASIVAQYGPRTTLAIALTPAASTNPEVSSKPTVVEFTWTDSTWWRVTRAHVVIKPETKIFAPGNLRATFDNAAYNRLVQYWISSKYTLRYTGGMVPDVFHILMKGSGIFCNPPSTAAPAKLRLLYECAPLALIVECAGISLSLSNMLFNLPSYPRPWYRKTKSKNTHVLLINLHQ
eukprot:TRINITY_DN237_c0_g4_i1.p1 TRINITY_DN237_c0_g4~~TRINITY_DN237_c0_g4_i1.p1  ORF type:complete len:319 (-),score=64.44 TRINITY_DN237_c0_g4_i1:365-1321(-)